MYQWHRSISLLIALPLLLWALSGFLHPIMTSFKPKIATQVLKPMAIDSSKIKLSLSEVLQKNKIDSITQFRLVQINNNWFYQIQRGQQIPPIYLSATNGNLLHNGDWLYAQWLARQFLEGQDKSKFQSLTLDKGSNADCCDNASDCVLNNRKGSKIVNASLVTDFNETYQSINRILPVWSVSFEREDGIQIFVETTQDRFVLAMDGKRAVFNKWFALIHTWGWLDLLGNGKLVVELILLWMVLATVFLGLFIFLVTKQKKANGNKILRARKAHRISALVIATTTIAFAFSGAFHAASKFRKDDRAQFFDQHWFLAAQLNTNLSAIQRQLTTTITNLSVVHMNGVDYWQVSALKPTETTANRDQAIRQPGKKEKVESAAGFQYLKTDDLSQLPQGDFVYAKYLATIFGHQPADKIQQIAVVNKFAGEYGFANKRLPVVKVVYNTNAQERYYVETATGKLALKLNNWEMLEGYSFAFLHKHEFLAPFGKPVKDFSTMFWAGAQVALVIIGMVLYLRTRKRKKMNG